MQNSIELQCQILDRINRLRHVQLSTFSSFRQYLQNTHFIQPLHWNGSADFTIFDGVDTQPDIYYTKKERKQDHILDDAATAEYEIKRTGGLDERNYHASETYENPERQN